MSETLNSVMPSVVNTLGLLDGLNLAKAVLSVIEPQVTSPGKRGGTGRSPVIDG